MFDLALKIFLFLSPIIFTSFGFAARYQWYQFGYFSSSINLLQLQFFQYGTIMLFLVALFNKSQRVIQDKWLGILLLLCIWSVFLHPKTIQSFHNIFLGFLLYYLVVSYTKNVKPMFKIIAVVATLNTIFAILQFFHIHFIYYPKREIFGLMSYKTQLGIYQALAMPICYVINPFLSIIPLIGLLLSKSITAVIAMLIGMIYLLREKISKIRFSFIYFMAFISLVGIYIIRLFFNFPHRLSMRSGVWVDTIKSIIQHPIYGYGVEIFKYIDRIKKMEFSDPYSLYLQVAYMLGIFGIFALILFFKDKFIGFTNITFITRGLFASCLILVVVGFGYSFLDYPRLTGTTIILFGLLTIMKGAKSEN